MNQTVIALIERIYAAAGHSAEWNHVLRDLSGLVGASSGCVVSATNHPERGQVNCFHDIDPEWIDAYNRWYCAYDPTLSILAQNPGRILVDHVTGPYLSSLRGRARVFYHEVMVPQSFRHTLQLGIAVPEGQGASLILQRSARHGAFSEQAVQGLNCLIPHLARALSLHARLDRLNFSRQDFMAAMDQTERGIILLDAAGGVVHLNRLARQLLRQSNTLYLTARGLSTGRADEQQALQASIRQALSLVPGRQRSRIRLRARNGSPSFFIEVTPLRAQHSSLLGNTGERVQALVWIDRYEQKRICAVSLSELYSLTRAEGEVLARLAEGHSQAEIARLRSVSQETVRSQIKSLMVKLGASRQTELVRMVLCDPAARAPMEEEK